MDDAPFLKEVMMAIIVAATTLAGLAGVVIGQISQSKLDKQLKRAFRLALVVSFIVATSAVIVAISWLVSPSDMKREAATSLFGAQLITFSVTTATFWLFRHR